VLLLLRLLLLLLCASITVLFITSLLYTIILTPCLRTALAGQLFEARIIYTALQTIGSATPQMRFLHIFSKSVLIEHSLINEGYLRYKPLQQ
jgi:hypothetical protein